MLVSRSAIHVARRGGMASGTQYLTRPRVVAPVGHPAPPPPVNDLRDTFALAHAVTVAMPGGVLASPESAPYSTT
jgi:hypothetical protein